MTPSEKRIHEVGSLAFCTSTVIDRLRVRASRLAADGFAYISRDELEALADRLNALSNIATEYHARLLEERADLTFPMVEDPSLIGVPVE